MSQVMLRHVKKISLILPFFMLVGCLSDAEKLEQARNRFIASKLELKKERREIYNYALCFAGYDLYNEVYRGMNDSVKLWAKNGLNFSQYMIIDSIQQNEKRVNDYRIDSLVCFNRQRDKCISAILNSYQESGWSDDIWYFYGVKIKTQWYFFRGATMVLPREYYQEDVHTPLSFETLKLLATKYVYKNYLKKNDSGEWEINDRFFSDLTSVAWCTTCRTQREWDSAYLYQVKLNWSNRSNQ